MKLVLRLQNSLQLAKRGIRVGHRTACVWSLAMLLFSAVSSDASDGELDLPEKVTFNAHIRPIMSNTCFACHGPDEESNPSEFRIDSFESATAALPSDDEMVGIKPGDLKASEVYQRITGESEGESMPPAEFRHQLSDYDKALFRRWIEQGAEYQQHWSYTPLIQPEVPTITEHADRVENEIDTFVLRKLARADLEPSPRADKARLLRRLSLDLIGLPPTVEELEAFLQDDAPDAYAKEVDRLLASEHFGERMATSWLDVVRFADSVGFHGDQNQRIYPYREYVINSLNNNKPFDQFTREQLAGDLIPNATTEQLAATGLVRLNMVTREGGAQPEEYLAKYTSDRVRVLGTAWLGATTGCCECHNHKFDPYSIKDFYSLGAFFDDIRQWGVYSDYGYTPNPELRGFNNDYPFPPEMRFKSETVLKQLSDLEERLEAVAASRVTPEQRKSESYASWIEHARELLQSHPDGWQPAAIDKVDAAKGVESEVLPDSSVLFTGKPKDVRCKLVLDVDASSPISAIRVEVLPDEANGGFVGREKDGRFRINLPLLVERLSDSPPTEEAESDSSKARYVRIDLSNNFLSLAEVQVFGENESGEEVNFALEGKASQSSDYKDYSAARAIDGDTNGSDDKLSYSHTQRGAKNWWELDLKSSRSIHRLAIWNRTSATFSVNNRLKGYRVTLLDEERNVVWRDQPALPQPFVQLEPGSDGKSAQKFLGIAWGQADRSSPQSYRNGKALPYLEGVWESGPAVWQLPKDEAKLKHTAVFQFSRPVTLKPGERLQVKLMSPDVGRVRLSVTPFVRLAAGMPAASDRLRQALLRPNGTQEEEDVIAAAYYLASQPAEKLDATIQNYHDAIANLYSGYATTLVADAVEPDERRVSRVLPRGDWQNKSGELVTPDTPDFLPKLPDAGERRLTRLDLADWLTSRDNPMTARHYVNRTWKHFFGTGLSARLDDLGNQGEWPSHPELLDWLAVDFMEHGWDIKRLIKQMVLSSTYQQAAAIRDDLGEVDPYNRLLAQQSARRLEAEAIRDNALSIAGLLQTDLIGGPSVKPYQPSGYWRVLSFPSRGYPTSNKREQYRRGVYIHWQRTFLHPMLANFDAPARDECTADRPVSNSPQQALTLLNDPSFVEASIAMADRLLNEKPGVEFRSRLNHAFTIALARPATDEEAKALQGLFDRQHEHFASADADRKSLLETGYFRPDPGLDPVEVAAWSQVCRVILNLHEVINRY